MLRKTVIYFNTLSQSKWNMRQESTAPHPKLLFRELLGEHISGLLLSTDPFEFQLIGID